ncbi:MAG: hypothetical protein NZ733_05515, partial [Aigarchaeota archaeon]|nr:hypothetical protein [Aigarchaeota archaeon]
EAPPAKEVYEGILKAFSELYGSIELIRANVKLAWSDETGGALVVRCSIGSSWKVLLAISRVTNVAGRQVALDVVRASGVIRRAKEELGRGLDHS